MQCLLAFSKSCLCVVWVHSQHVCADYPYSLVCNWWHCSYVLCTVTRCAGSVPLFVPVLFGLLRWTNCGFIVFVCCPHFLFCSLSIPALTYEDVKAMCKHSALYRVHTSGFQRAYTNLHMYSVHWQSVLPGLPSGAAMFAKITGLHILFLTA